MYYFGIITCKKTITGQLFVWQAKFNFRKTRVFQNIIQLLLSTEGEIEKPKANKNP